jgi:hypothetical protein
MPADMIAHFNTEICSLIWPSESVEGVAETAACLCHKPNGAYYCGSPKRIVAMPTNEKPATNGAQPIRFVFPRGISAEEAARRIQEMVEKHRQRESGKEPKPKYSLELKAQFHCHNQDCHVRQVTAEFKFENGRTETTPPNLKCPACGEPLDFYF